MTPSKLSWVCDVVHGALPGSVLFEAVDGANSVTFRTRGPVLDELRAIAAAAGTEDLRVLAFDTTSVLLVLSY